MAHVQPQPAKPVRHCRLWLRTWVLSAALHAAALVAIAVLCEGPPGGGGRGFQRGAADGPAFEASFSTATRDGFDTALPSDGPQGNVVAEAVAATFIAELLAESSAVREPVPAAPPEQNEPAEILQTGYALTQPESQESIDKRPTSFAAALARVEPIPVIESSHGERSPDRLGDAATSQSAAHGGAGRPGRAQSRRAGEAGASFFSIAAPGRRFVYVIDASDSMRHLQAFRRATAELFESLRQLPPAARFQIVFYEAQPHPLRHGSEAGLFQRTSANLRLARQFARSIQPSGGTDHLAALQSALDLDPDAIFLLTDADEPRLTDRDLADLRRQNRRRTPIHAVEFGAGSDPGDENFLRRLAREHQGEHRYVDLTADHLPE